MFSCLQTPTVRFGTLLPLLWNHLFEISRQNYIRGMLLSRSRQDSCVAQATDPAHAGACNFRWPISSGTHLFTRPAKQSRDRWDFLWSPALPPRGKPGHLYCHLTAKLVRPCIGHVRDTCSVWVLRTGSCCPCWLPDLCLVTSRSGSANCLSPSPLLWFHGVRAAWIIIFFSFPRASWIVLFTSLSSLPGPHTGSDS